MGPKKKKTKAELEEERLAREVEAHKAAEAEKARQAALAEERRIEAERIKAENRAARIAELERLKESASEHNSKLSILEAKKVAAKAETAAVVEWENIRSPSGGFSVSDAAGRSEFFRSIRESATTSHERAFEVCCEVAGFGSRLEASWIRRVQERDFASAMEERIAIAEVANLLSDCFDEATVLAVAHGEATMRSDRMEINVEQAQADGVGLALWASYSESRLPRKSIVMDTLGMTLDVPKQLLQQDINYIYRFRVFSICGRDCDFQGDKGSAHPSDGKGAGGVPESAQNSRPASALPSAAAGETAASSDTAMTIPDAAAEASLETLLAGTFDESPDVDFYILGKLFAIDLVVPPPAATYIDAKNWTVRPRQPSRADGVVGGAREHRRPTLHPYPSSVAWKGTYTVPAGILMDEDLVIQCWDAATAIWGTGSIHEQRVDVSARTISFSSTHCGIYALTRLRTRDLPLERWSLGAVAGGTETAVQLSLGMQRGQEVRLLCHGGRAARGDMCSLESATPPMAELDDLVGKPLLPAVLLLQLRRRGLNLLPFLSDIAGMVAVHSLDSQKERLTEEDLLSELSRCAVACDFLKQRFLPDTSLKAIQVAARVELAQQVEAAIALGDEELVKEAQGGLLIAAKGAADEEAAALAKAQAAAPESEEVAEVARSVEEIMAEATAEAQAQALETKRFAIRVRESQAYSKVRAARVPSLSCLPSFVFLSVSSRFLSLLLCFVEHPLLFWFVNPPFSTVHSISLPSFVLLFLGLLPLPYPIQHSARSSSTMNMCTSRLIPSPVCSAPLPTWAASASCGWCRWNQIPSCSSKASAETPSFSRERAPASTSRVRSASNFLKTRKTA
jgi:hypothetical protein